MCYTQTRQQISENDIFMLEIWTGLYSNMFREAWKGKAQWTNYQHLLLAHIKSKHNKRCSISGKKRQRV